MKIYFVNSSNPASKDIADNMLNTYGQSDIENADCVVVLGGDGTVLRAIHETFNYNLPIYAMNCGKIGFLANKYKKEDLIERISVATAVNINPLKITSEDIDGNVYKSIAINELYMLRQTHQSAIIKIIVDDVCRMEELICDGVIVATPVGSTAYNYSANGVILPIGSPLISLTPINSFRPRKWSGSVLLDSNANLEFIIIDEQRRPVCAVADYEEHRDISKIHVVQSKDEFVTLLFDDESRLEKKILEEQFCASNM